MQEHVTVETDGGVEWIRFDRAEHGNAFTAEMFEMAADALSVAERDSRARAILFTGMPGLFTSGHDVEELRRYAGKESKYFVITGAEVLDLLPTGYGFVLDIDGQHRMVFDAKAVEQMVDFTMRRMYG